MYRMLRIIGDNPLRAVETPVLYLDGYSVAERLLEGATIKITLNTEGNVDITLPKLLPKWVDKQAMIDDARRTVTEFTDCFATTEELDDDDGILWDTNKSAEDQIGGFSEYPIIENGAQLPVVESKAKTTKKEPPKAIKVLSFTDIMNKINQT